MTEIERSVAAKGITRLCHFTPSRNLQHIAAGQAGILATARLSVEERAAYNATDLQRLDGFRGHICCSIEYPNAWYFDRVRNDEKLFPDWVVLLIRPDYLWKPSTLFCPRNAAAGYGAAVKAGSESFDSLYAPAVRGQGGQTRTRSPAQIPACPTDQQAEVLIEDQIHMEDILAVAVENPKQAQTERVRMEVNGVNPDLFKFVSAPAMFKKYDLSAAIMRGMRPLETVLPPFAVVD